MSSEVTSPLPQLFEKKKKKSKTEAPSPAGCDQRGKDLR